MDIKYFIYWCKEKCADIKSFFKWLSVMYSVYADRLNIFLAKHNIVKVFTVYDIYYGDIPVAVAATYDKLRNHYDDLIYQVDSKLVSGVDGLYEWDLKFKSRKSLINTFFKTTLM